MIVSYFNGTTMHLQVRWADRVAPFARDWQNSLATQADDNDTEHWHRAVDTVLGAIEQGPDQAEQVLAEVYELTGQLPIPGDRAWVGPLEVQVDQRCFVLSRSAGVGQVEVHYLLGVERYRYAATPASAEAAEQA